MSDQRRPATRRAAARPGKRVTWHRVLASGLGLAGLVAVVACGSGTKKTGGSGVYYTAVATPAYYSGPGTPHAVPPGTPAITVGTPGPGTPSASPRPAATPTKNP